jgi:hypothetical protein
MFRSHKDAALAGRIGGLRRSAKHDSREMTAKAREAFHDKFLAEVDPQGVLPEAERLRRADAARKAYYAGLAYKSAMARRKASPSPR